MGSAETTPRRPQWTEGERERKGQQRCWGDASRIGSLAPTTPTLVPPTTGLLPIDRLVYLRGSVSTSGKIIIYSSPNVDTISDAISYALSTSYQLFIKVVVNPLAVSGCMVFSVENISNAQQPTLRRYQNFPTQVHSINGCPIPSPNLQPGDWMARSGTS